MTCRIMKYLCAVFASCALLLLSPIFAYKAYANTIDFYNSQDFSNFIFSSSGTVTMNAKQTNYFSVILDATSNGQVYNPVFTFRGANVDNGTQFKFSMTALSSGRNSLQCPASTSTWVIDNCVYSSDGYSNVSGAKWDSTVGLVNGTFSHYFSSDMTIYGHYVGSNNLTYQTQISLSGTFFIFSGSGAANVYFSPVTFYRDHQDNSVANAIQGTTNAINSGFDQQHKDNQQALEESKKQTEAMEQTKDFVTDSSTPDASDIANADSLPSVGLLPAGPIDSLLLLPLNIMNSITSSLGGSCSPIVAPLPFSDGQSLTFPCFGDTIYSGDFSIMATLVGSVASAFILYEYFKHLYKKVDRATSLETSDEDEWGIL